jgi:hypothetical protein
MVSSIQVRVSTVSVYVCEVTSTVTIKTKVNQVSYKIPKKALQKKEYFSSIHSLYLLVQGYGKKCDIPPIGLPNSPTYLF